MIKDIFDSIKDPLDSSAHTNVLPVYTDIIRSLENTAYTI